jgi:hypothetical protein
MTKQLVQSGVSKHQVIPYGSLLLSEFFELDGMGANLSHKRREFCSEFFDLSASLQDLVVAAQSKRSLLRLVETMSGFKNPDTGELYHQKEISLIEAELSGRKQNSSKQITMMQLELALNSLRHRKH